MKRKLAAKKQTPLDYLKARILNPIGVKIADWVHDASGNPHMPNGAHLTARDWAKFGQWLLQGGQWNGKQIVKKDLLEECFKPSQANLGYGLTFWLNQPGGVGLAPEDRMSKADDKGGFIYPGGCPDLAGALGAGQCRMYVIPSRKMVVLRQCETPRDRYQDDVFLALLFGGNAASRDR
jgi:CubicO group peptidase (beta-lactamase class C family)